MSLVIDYTSGFFEAAPTGEGVGTDPSTIGDSSFADVSLLLHGDGTSGSTTITDSSSNSVSMTVTGNTQIDTAVKKFGTGSIQFDGSGDQLSFTNTGFGTGDFTYEAWVYPESQTQRFPTCFRVVNDALTANKVTVQYDHEIAADKFRFNVGTDLILSDTKTANQWYHIAVVRSGTTLTFYLDGVSVGTHSYSYNVPSNTVFIGGDVAASSDTPFKGFIDELRITKGVARYTSNFTPPTAAFSNNGPTLDLSSGNVFSHAPSANVAYTFTNPPSSGTSYDFTLKVTPSATVTITWPSSVEWPSGTAPTAPASGETDVYTFFTTDNGTTYYGNQVGDAVS